MAVSLVCHRFVPLRFRFPVIFFIWVNMRYLTPNVSAIPLSNTSDSGLVA